MIFGGFGVLLHELTRTLVRKEPTIKRHNIPYSRGLESRKGSGVYCSLVVPVTALGFGLGSVGITAVSV